MRPLKLVMSAFGPYAKEEVLDFTNLKEKNLFLITGPTGAGKTTIFDALSVALYGEASGSSRDKDSLRSDFAEDVISTYVELSFSLNGKEYKIKRYPQQLKKKARGEGYIQKSAEAELMLPGGKLLTGVKSVDEKVSEILGITSQQFKQIVMLPQGEFRRLLEAESLEREKIFRKIFGTEAFLYVQKNLEEKERELYKNISKISEERDVYIKNIDAGEEELLFSLKEAKDKKIDEIIDLTKVKLYKDEDIRKNLKTKLDCIREQQEDLQKQLTKAVDINRRLKYKEELKEALNKELLKEEYIKKKIEEVQLTKKALEIIPTEENLRIKEENRIKKEREFLQEKKNFEINSKKLEEAKVVLDKEINAEYMRKKFTEDISILKGFQPKVIEYENKKVNLEKLLVKGKNLEEERNKNREKIFKIKNELEYLEVFLNDIQKKELLKVKREQDLNKVTDNINSLLELYDKFNKHFIKYKEHEKEVLEFNILNNKFKILNTEYIETYERFIKGQAGLLAEELEDNNPCPVCGSLEHPKKAVKLKETPTAEEVEQKKLEAYNAEKACTEKANNIASIKASIEELKNIYEDTYNKISHILSNSLGNLKVQEKLILIKEKGGELRNIQKNIEKEIEEIEKVIEKKEESKARKEKLNLELKNNEMQKELLEKEFTELYGRTKSEQELLLSVEKEIPDNKRSLNLLNSEIKKCESDLRAMEEAYKIAEERFREISSIKALSEGNLKVKEENLKESIKEVKDYEEKFKELITSYGFKDYYEYASLKRTKEYIEAMENSINEYKDKVKSLKDRIEEVEKETLNMDKVNEEKILEEIKSWKEKEEEVNKEDNKLFARIDNNQKQLKKINKLTLSIAKGEEEYKVVAELSKLAKGDNSEKLSFERYVLAAYFNEIIQAANIRLMKMTGRRFLLKRKEERVKGNKQSGLELEVFDNYTGKARHVKTLSGGESFKASLALALGLADVIQSYTGGIRVDTMFIDEGFGSLDQESLDNAINCLIDLQKGGRLVGIISHVSELKERIDARLEVTPAKEGSHIRFNI